MARALNPSNLKFSVSGTLTNRAGKPISDLQVIAFDRDLRSEILLGNAISNSKGYYQIAYSPEKLIKSKKSLADVVIKVLNPETSELYYETPIKEIRFNAPPNTTINIQLQREVLPTKSEYEIVMDCIKPLLGDTKLEDLQENSKFKDITFLAGETGLLEAQLHHIGIANKLKAITRISPIIFYALLRKNTFLNSDYTAPFNMRLSIDINANLMPLVYETALLNPKIMIRDITLAIRDRIIPKLNKVGLARTRKMLQRFRNDAAKYQKQEKPNLIPDYLDGLLNQEKIDQMLKLWTDSKGDMVQFLETVTGPDFLGVENEGKQTSPPNDPKLSTSGKGNDQIIKQAIDVKGLTKPGEEKELAKMNKAEWKRFLSGKKNKITIDDAPINRRTIDLHALTLAQEMERAFPTTAFAAQLKREKNPKFANHRQMIKLLESQPELDLQKSNIDLFFKERNLNSAKDDSLKKDLKSIQRIFQLIPKYSKTNRLLDQKIHSAQQIVALGEQRFIKEVGSNIGLTQIEAKTVFRKAQSKNVATMLVAGEIKSLIESGKVNALQSGLTEGTFSSISDDFPNLKSLFSLTDTCECKHCRSVYSPAAYLVELIEFLDNRRIVDVAKSAKDVLLERRPELVDLDLNCANATTPVPYIDLVCETLEEAIVPDPGVSYKGTIATGIAPIALINTLKNAEIPVTEHAVIYDMDRNGDFILRDEGAVCKLIEIRTDDWLVKRLHQTHGSAQELAASPEYLNIPAYDELATRGYGFALPFNLAHTESQAYFSRFNLSRGQLMEDFQIESNPELHSIAAEKIGLTNAERELIVKENKSDQESYWNIPKANLLAEMQIVDTFLSKTGLSYNEVNLLLQLHFIDEAKSMYIQHLNGSCDTEQKLISELTMSALDKIHRFLRLQKKTGIQIQVLDKLINQVNLGNKKLNDKFLIVLSQLIEIEELTGISLDQLTGCFGSIPHKTYTNSNLTSLYLRIFQNKTTNGTVDPALSLENINGSSTLDSISTSLAACLHVSDQDLNQVIGLLPDDSLTKNNLSALYAHTQLASATGISISDYVRLIDLSNATPFSNSANALAFTKLIIKTQQGPLPVEKVSFMLQHKALDLSLLEISDEKIAEILTQLQASFQESFDANRSPYNNQLPPEEMYGDLKDLLLTLPELTEETAISFLKMTAGDWNSSRGDGNAETIINDALSDFFDTSKIISYQQVLETTATDPNADLENDQKVLLKSLLDSISNYLYQIERSLALTTLIASAFAVEEELASEILKVAVLKQSGPGTDFIRDLLSSDQLIDRINIPAVKPVIDVATFAEQFNAFRLLHKLFPLTIALEVPTEEISNLFQMSKELGWLELDQIPYKAGQSAINYPKWIELLEIINLWKQLVPVVNPTDAKNPITFPSTMQLLFDSNSTSSNKWLNRMALLTGYNRIQLGEIDAHFGFSTNLKSYRNSSTWREINACIEDLRLLGSTYNQTLDFIKPSLVNEDVKTLRMSLKSRYDDVTWVSTLTEIMDSIRPKKRDALVAYLIETNVEIKDSNDLYDYFLVDVEMEACMPSSRIVQAHGTVQLFAQRCLMGIEPAAIADVKGDSGWDQWEWMRLYRVWEANRKVFLYPENWIESELLDNKSYLFKDFEDELLQNEVNDANTEEALLRYLDKLDDVAFLEVMATYYQSSIYTMHVFARSKGGDPAQYYYRKLEGERYWSPWEKVDLDITSSQLLAFERNGRLHLAWPIFREEPDPTQTLSTSNPEEPRKRLNIQLAISELSNSQWKPKKVSQDGVAVPSNYILEKLDEDAFDQSRYTLFYSQFTEQIGIIHSKLEAQDVEIHELHGIFNIAGCKGYPELASSIPSRFYDSFPDFQDGLLKSQRYLEQGHDTSDKLAIRNVFTFFNFKTLLNKTPGSFRITYPMQFTLLDLFPFLISLLVRVIANKTGTSVTAKIPMGSLLTYFFEDSNQAYSITPGFYGTVTQGTETTQVQRTGSDVLKLIQEVIALFAKYLEIYLVDPTINLELLKTNFLSDPDYLSIKSELEIYPNLTYQEHFKNLYHPLLCKLKTSLNNDGIPGLMSHDTQSFVNSTFNFNDNYAPNPSAIAAPYPVEDLDFSSDGSYSAYNWELYYHIPMMVATRLVKDQRFEESMTWFHYMFNPTGTGNDAPAPQKYWVTKPFFETMESDYVTQRIDSLLYKVADPTTLDIAELEFAVDQWREKPFMPHVVARFRPVAYQKTLLMKYIDALVEWGDYNFRQDTMESIVQATQLYILADKLLGPKPRRIPPTVTVPAQTYNQLETSLGAFGNALVEFENLIPDVAALPEGGKELPPAPITMSSLYFCIPDNEKMHEYWDRIEDRLFKVRNCQNIDGIERTLALFAPPIDPGMLVKAAAGGLSISSILSGLNTPLPHYRFDSWVQRATELTQEVRSLGSSLLQALEKKDSETLALLRSDLEIKLLGSVRDMKQLQIDQAAEEIISLEKSKQITSSKLKYYLSRKYTNANETLNLTKMKKSRNLQEIAQGIQLGVAIAAIVPEIDLGASGWAATPVVKARFGGLNLSSAAKGAVDVMSFLSLLASNEAQRAATLGKHDRRFEDWQFQASQSRLELDQINQQIIAAELRKEIAETDLKNHDIQIENTVKIEEFMQSKYTNKDLYQWMIGQISSVYFKAYQLAFDTAKKAERCYQYERGTTDSFLKFGYWDSLKKGLQSADHLYHDIKRMEINYLDDNKREYELTKNVSLALLDPLALEQLKTTGACDFGIQEAHFDMDHPGHYFRRIKSVSVSLPCIAGPYISVSGKLSQLSNKYRKSTSGAYAEDPGNDTRFVYNVGNIQSVATSSALNDSGLFELNFRDERFLPFEGTGAVSKWRFELPKEVQQFDYNTISDMIIQIKYMSREGGSALRTNAESTLKTQLNALAQELGKSGLHVGYSLRHDLPDVWHAFKTKSEASITIEKSRLPYFAQPLSTSIVNVVLIARFKTEPGSFTVFIDGKPEPENTGEQGGLLFSNTDGLYHANTNLISQDTLFELTTNDDLQDLEDFVLIVNYAV